MSLSTSTKVLRPMPDYKVIVTNPFASKHYTLELHTSSIMFIKHVMQHMQSLNEIMVQITHKFNGPCM